MSTLQERLRQGRVTNGVAHVAAEVIDSLASRLDAAEAKLDAIDAYVVQLRQEGGPVCDTIARHLTEFLHPEEGTDE